jgi:hypothetical protein
MDNEDKFNLAMRYAAAHPKFCTSFLDDIELCLANLTDAQEEALDNIVYSFRMVRWDQTRKARAPEKRNPKEKLPGMEYWND